MRWPAHLSYALCWMQFFLNTRQAPQMELDWSAAVKLRIQYALSLTRFTHMQLSWSTAVKIFATRPPKFHCSSVLLHMPAASLHSRLTNLRHHPTHLQGSPWSTARQKIGCSTHCLPASVRALYQAHPLQQRRRQHQRLSVSHCSRTLWMCCSGQAILLLMTPPAAATLYRISRHKTASARLRRCRTSCASILSLHS